MAIVNLQSLTNLDSSGQSTKSGITLNAGESLQGTVKQVSQDQLNPKVFRVKVEADSRLMELQTRQPIAQGSQVTIARDTNGNLTVNIQNQTPNNNQTAAANTQAQTQTNTATINLRAPAVPLPTTGQTQTTLSQQLNQLIPIGTTVTANVTQQSVLTTVPASPLAATTTLATSTTNMSAPPPATVSVPNSIQPTVARAPAAPLIPATAQPAGTNAAAAHVATPTANQAAAPQVTPQAIAPATPPTQPISATNTTTTSADLARPTLNSVSTGASHSTTSSTSLTQSAQPTQTAPITHTSNSTLGAASTHTPAGQLLTVSVKGQTLQLQTPVNLPPLKEVTIERPASQQLQLSWTTNQQAPTVKPPVVDNIRLSPNQQQTVNQILRESLPVQRPLAEGLQQLSNAQASSNNAGVDKAVQAILQLFSVTPGSQDAEQSIRQNVQLGGLFTENRLANQQPVNQDMKQFLGKLDALADQLPAAQREAVKGAVDSMMSRITQQQITQVQHRQDRTDTTERFYQLDLPVHFQEALDNVEMRIQQRDSQNEHGQWDTLWRIRLHFELGKDGMIDADISLNESTQAISALFACSENNTAHRVRGQLDEFSQRLSQLGFESSSLTCRQGNIAAQKSPIQKQLIDVKT